MACLEPHSKQVITKPPGKVSKPLPASTEMVLLQLRHSALTDDTQNSFSTSFAVTSAHSMSKRPVLGISMGCGYEVRAFKRVIRSRPVESM